MKETNHKRETDKEINKNLSDDDDLFKEKESEKKQGELIGCKCSKSNCLRLHCSCFKQNKRCNKFCSCVGCINKEEHQEAVNFVI